MPEILLYFIWQNRLWALFDQTTTDGRPLEILSTGQRNPNAGPDFTDVHLRIDGQEWIGDVEMHVHSGDWYHHHHHLDPAYNRIILHVVNEADKMVYTSEGNAVVQCELQYPKDQDYLTQLIQSVPVLDNPNHLVSCSALLKMQPQLLSQGWRHTLLQTRLDAKKQSIHDLLKITDQDWNHAFYITLAHNFGFHTNSIPFETLALCTPLSCLLKHRDNLFQLTAILLGQSGLLKKDSTDTKEKQSLWEEYSFLQHKFLLRPMDASIWKMSRLRPQNFPQVRIRQFAQILQSFEFLFSTLMELSNVDEMIKLLSSSAIKDESTSLDFPPKMGKDAIRILLINTVFPYQYTYALAHNNPTMAEKVLARYEVLPAEDNSIIRLWRKLGQKVDHAADSQALIHLFQNFCQPHDCIHCEVGHIVFQQQQLELF